jgi:hypothetical protein
MSNHDIALRAQRYLDSLPKAPGMYAEDTPEALVRDCLQAVKAERMEWDRFDETETALEDAVIERDAYLSESERLRAHLLEIAKLAEFKFPELHPSVDDNCDALLEHLKGKLNQESAHA